MFLGTALSLSKRDSRRFFSHLYFELKLDCVEFLVLEVHTFEQATSMYFSYTVFLRIVAAAFIFNNVTKLRLVFEGDLYF